MTTDIGAWVVTQSSETNRVWPKLSYIALPLPISTHLILPKVWLTLFFCTYERINFFIGVNYLVQPLELGVKKITNLIQLVYNILKIFKLFKFG